MSFSLNLGSLGTLSTSPLSGVSMGVPTFDLKANFVSKYGSYSTPYDNLDSIGNQTFKTQWPMLASIVGIFLAIFCFIGSAREVDPETKQEMERSGMKKFLLGLGWLILLSSLFGFGYGGYLYFAVYLPQYYKWLESLPSEAKVSLGTIKTIDSLVSQVNSKNRR